MAIVNHSEVLKLNQLITELNNLSEMPDYRRFRECVLLRMNEIQLHEPSRFITDVSFSICRYFINFALQRNETCYDI